MTKTSSAPRPITQNSPLHQPYTVDHLTAVEEPQIPGQLAPPGGGLKLSRDDQEACRGVKRAKPRPPLRKC